MISSDIKLRSILISFCKFNSWSWKIHLFSKMECASSGVGSQPEAVKFFRMATAVLT